MTLRVNGKAVDFEGSVADLIQERCGERAPAGVAVAVNEVVVPRGDWERRTLVPGDRVELVTAVQGG
ncbi:MAG: sulfur carrier protein ThiS [Solirubrobacterales bacterium]|nr:sulfur carrier protein ThiS [Solirubrobacterales bacterium]